MEVYEPRVLNASTLIIPREVYLKLIGPTGVGMTGPTGPTGATGSQGTTGPTGYANIGPGMFPDAAIYVRGPGSTELEDSGIPLLLYPLNTLSNMAITPGANITALLASAGTGNLSVGIGAFSSPEPTASYNTSFGMSSLSNLLTGTRSTCMGYTSGSSYNGAESDNICLGPVGGVSGESGAIRIASTGNNLICIGDESQTTSLGATGTYVSNIYDASIISTSPVFVDGTTNQLGILPNLTISLDPTSELDIYLGPGSVMGTTLTDDATYSIFIGTGSSYGITVGDPSTLAFDLVSNSNLIYTVGTGATFTSYNDASSTTNSYYGPSSNYNYSVGSGSFIETTMGSGITMTTYLASGTIMGITMANNDAGFNFEAKNTTSDIIFSVDVGGEDLYIYNNGAGGLVMNNGGPDVDALITTNIGFGFALFETGNGGDNNTAMGFSVLSAITDSGAGEGNYNTAVGNRAMATTEAGIWNCVFGALAGWGLVNVGNCAFGPYALGSYPNAIPNEGPFDFNIGIGALAGASYNSNSSYNVVIGNNVGYGAEGFIGNGLGYINDNNTIRIAANQGVVGPIFLGNNVQGTGSGTYIDNIYPTTGLSGELVGITSTGQLFNSGTPSLMTDLVERITKLETELKELKNSLSIF